MLIIRDRFALSEIKKNHAHFFDTLVKIVIDLENKKMALNGEMHADLEQELLQDGSDQKNLWGANLYFNKTSDTFIEYTSLINIRPAQNNRSMEITDPSLRNQIREVVYCLIEYDV